MLLNFELVKNILRSLAGTIFPLCVTNASEVGLSFRGVETLCRDEGGAWGESLERLPACSSRRILSLLGESVTPRGGRHSSGRARVWLQEE